MPYPSPGDLSDPGIEAAGGFFTTSAIWEPHIHVDGPINGGASGKEPTCQCRRHETQV